MTEDTALLLFAALAVFAVVVISFVRGVTGRLGEVSRQLRSVDARLAHEVPVLATRIGAARSDLAAVSAQAERALWSLSRVDARLDAATEGLKTRRVAIERDGDRLVAARSAIIRIKKSARIVLKMLELRRAILG
jgi:hypothetical protein